MPDSDLENLQTTSAPEWCLIVTRRFRIAKFVLIQYPRWPPWWSSWKSWNDICSQTVSQIKLWEALGRHVEKVREKSRECHNHKPQPFPDTKRKRKQAKPNKRKSNKCTKSTKISSPFPEWGICNAKRKTQEQNNTRQDFTLAYSRLSHEYSSLFIIVWLIWFLCFRFDALT